VQRGFATGELAFYRCCCPTIVPLRELVRVAGRRWTIEESFQAGKGLAGLDERQVRRWTSWRRWTLLAMIAHALPTVIAAKRAHRPSRTRRPDPVDLRRDPPPDHRSRRRTPPPRGLPV
jgi:SRSO17 transposase